MLIPQSSITCAICGKAITLGQSKVTEDGKPLHEDCFVKKIKSSISDWQQPPKWQDEIWGQNLGTSMREDSQLSGFQSQTWAEERAKLLRQA